MSTKPRLKRAPQHADTRRADKAFEELAERIFRDESPAEPLFGILEDNAGEKVA